jgi:hypothetical protein
MWRRAFPGVSWQTIQNTPRSLWQLGTSRIGLVEVSPGSQDMVVQASSRLGNSSFRVHRRSQGSGSSDWFVMQTGPMPRALVIRIGGDSEPLGKGLPLGLGVKRNEGIFLNGSHSATKLRSAGSFDPGFSASLSNSARLELGR